MSRQRHKEKATKRYYLSGSYEHDGERRGVTTINSSGGGQRGYTHRKLAYLATSSNICRECRACVATSILTRTRLNKNFLSKLRRLEAVTTAYRGLYTTGENATVNLAPTCAVDDTSSMEKPLNLNGESRLQSTGLHIRASSVLLQT